mmetsp:Transcript_28202/g.49238  ORF Transcript_28202/g.49238 Transcript_28202/m.49238 type:complete len:554 (-) Transcript_28202:29-1690(-)
MRRIASALACLACAGHAFRLQSPPAEMQGCPLQEGQKSPKAQALRDLANFLSASKPSGAFDPAGARPAVLNKRRRPRHCVPTMKTFSGEKAEELQDFRKWIEKLGGKALVDVNFGSFAGERGVGAAATIKPGSQVLAVPSRLALEVTDITTPPKWCNEETWKSVKWDAKLAMLLLFEDKNPDSLWRKWLDLLPRDYGIPCLRPKMLSALESLGFAPLARDVRKQRAEWDKAFEKAPDNPTAAQFDWAMATVRSRAFTGPYTGSTLQSSVTAFALICTACLLWAIVAGGAGALEFSYDAVLTAAIAIFANDLIIGPRFSKMKRHVVCPWIDFINHKGGCEGSEFTYEYFQDSFAAIVDPKGRPIKKGEQVYVSYGARSNDKLLQYYGFVQPDNPHDAYTTDQENLIVGINSALPSGLPEGALNALKAAGLTDSQRAVDLHAKGADEAALRLTRLLTHPKLAKNDGLDALPASAEAASLRTLAQVARAREAELAASTLVETDKHDADEDSRLLATFVEEKKKVLRASADALELQASNLDLGPSTGVPVAQGSTVA